MTDTNDEAQPEKAPASSVPAQYQPILLRRIIGPFRVVEVVAVLVSVAVTAAVLLFATTPLAAPGADQPKPGSSFYLVGPAGQGLRVGDVAPELTGLANGEEVGLTDLDGNPIRLADLRGHPVWINFWATWCPPCQEETPVLRDVYEEFAPSGLKLVAISVQETSIDDVRAYVQRFGLRYTIGFDATSAVFHTYRAYGLPTHVFVDGQGVIREIILGPVTRDRAEQIVTRLFAP